MKEYRWVQPKLVSQVEFVEWTMPVISGTARLSQCVKIKMPKK